MDDAPSPTISTSRHAGRAWPCRERWNEKRRELWRADPGYRASERERKRKYRATAKERRSLAAKALHLMGWVEPRFHVGDVLMTIQLSANQVRFLARRANITLPGSAYGWSIAEAMLLKYIVALSTAIKARTPQRFDYRQIKFFWEKWVETPSEGIEQLSLHPEMQLKLELHREKFFRSLLKSNRKDLECAYGIGSTPKPIKPKKHSPLTAKGKAAPFNWV